MPELAAIYALGFFTCWLCTGFFVLLWRKRRTSRAATTLNANLRKVGLFWSDHRDRLEDWSEDVEKEDWNKTRTSVLLMGAMFSLLSWLGLVLIGVLMISVRVLARSRLERRLYASSLSRSTDLSEEEVKALVSNAKAQ